MTRCLRTPLQNRLPRAPSFATSRSASSPPPRETRILRTVSFLENGEREAGEEGAGRGRRMTANGKRGRGRGMTAKSKLGGRNGAVWQSPVRLPTRISKDRTQHPAYPQVKKSREISHGFHRITKLPRFYHTGAFSASPAAARTPPTEHSSCKRPTAPALSPRGSGRCRRPRRRCRRFGSSGPTRR